MERKACILKAHPLTLSVPSRGSQCRAKSDSPSLPPAGLALFFWNEPVYVHRRQEEGPRHMQDINSVKPDERLALDLMAAIRADAEAACAPSPVEMVSVTIDVSSEAGQGAETVIEPRIDRRTRTILFTGGMARQGDTPVMKATAVYRILPEA